LYQYYAKGTFKGFDAKAFYAISMDHEYRKEWDQYAIEIVCLEELPDGTECFYWSCKIYL
jgi:hypothetical protein